jgi:hypothetical protein
MSARLTATIAGAAALAVSGTVLGLLWRYGIWEYLLFGGTDLRLILWPSSAMLPIDWCTSARGMLITLFSVLANCFMYVGFALTLRMCISALRRSLSFGEKSR